MVSKDQNKERTKAKKNAGPILDGGIGTRISEVSEMIGSRKKAASVACITADQLARYIREENQPRLVPMANLCRAAGVYLEWMVSGKGPKLISESHKGVTLDMAAPGTVDLEELADLDLLSEVMQGLDWIIADEGKPMPYAIKAQLTLVLYDYYRDRGIEAVSLEKSADVINIFSHLNRKKGNDEKG